MKLCTICLLAMVYSLSGIGAFASQEGALSLQIINNVADPTAGAFTVKINGQTLTSSLGFRQATSMQALPLPIQLSITSSNAAFEPMEKTFTADVYDGGTIILTLYGVGKPSDFSNAIPGRDINYAMHEYAVIAGNIAPSKVNLTVLHAATDLPVFDMSVGGNQFVATDLGYATTPEFPLALVPQKYTLALTPNGKPNEPWKIGEADFSKDAGKLIYLLPSGFLNPAANKNGPALELLAVYPDGKVVVLMLPKEKTYARMQLIYAGSDPNATSVDVYANTTKIADNIPFIGATSFMDIQADEPITLVVAEPNSNASDDKVLASLSGFRPATNANHIVVIHGVVSASGFVANPDNLPITLSYSVIENARMVSAGAPTDSDVAVCHAITDAPALSLLSTQVPPTLFASSVAYRGISSYEPIVNGMYTVGATYKEGNDTKIMGIYEANLSALSGKPIVLLAAGFLKPAENKNGSAAGLYMITTTGTITKLEPSTVSVGEEQQHSVLSLTNYPNPADAFTTLSYELASYAPVTLTVYDATGRSVYRVERGVQQRGTHSVQLPTFALAQGTYQCTLQTGTHVVTRTLQVVR